MNTSRPLILASTSPYRRELLERLGLEFTCLPPAVDEEAEAGRHSGRSFDELALALATAKARAVALHRPDAVIIAGDQIAAIEARRLSKPGNRDRCVDQLTLLSGREHRLITALVVIDGEAVHRHVEVATMRMRRLDPKQIERYVDHDQPLDCAGSYKIERGGIALFESIAVGDHTSITGMPLIALTSILRRLGWQVP